MDTEISEKLVPLFMPKLAQMLYYAETEKGSPLTEAEVIAVRDNAVAVMVRESAALAMAEKRGADIDPENVWLEWQAVRKELVQEG